MIKIRHNYIVHTSRGDNIPIRTTCPEVAAQYVEIIMGKSHGPFTVTME